MWQTELYTAGQVLVERVIWLQCCLCIALYMQIQAGVEINVCGYVMALILVVGFREYAI